LLSPSPSLPPPSPSVTSSPSKTKPTGLTEALRKWLLLPALVRWGMGAVLSMSVATGSASLAQASQPQPDGSPCAEAADCLSGTCNVDGLCAGAAPQGQAPSAVRADLPTPADSAALPDTDAPGPIEVATAPRAIPVTQQEVGTLMSLLTFLRQGGLLAVVIVLTIVIGALAREYAKARDAQIDTLNKTRDEEKATLNALTQVLVQNATIQTQVSEALENLSASFKSLDENQRAAIAKLIRATDRLALRMEGRKIVNDDEFDESTPPPKD